MPSFSRRDVGYTVVSRFEETLRSFILRKVNILLPRWETGVPEGVLKKAKARSTGVKGFEDASDFLEATDFPDLKEIILYGGFKAYFPDCQLRQEDFERVMDELYSIRCAIAHVRRYFTSLELDTLIENTCDIATHLGPDGHAFLQFIKDLKDRPEALAIPLPEELMVDHDYVAPIPNNLPVPDYEFEGGFVGREKDIKKIRELLEGDLHRVITISGAGGVGKTALALATIDDNTE
jgi:LuxR family glucitol operon transcriptional activator